MVSGTCTYFISVLKNQFGYELLLPCTLNFLTNAAVLNYAENIKFSDDDNFKIKRAIF